MEINKNPALAAWLPWVPVALWVAGAVLFAVLARRALPARARPEPAETA